MSEGFNRPLCWAYSGQTAYSEALARQESWRDQIRDRGAEDGLFLLEHPHVYTLGRSADRTDLLSGDSELERRGIEVHDTDRGGQVTYHGPGQLVGYPVLNLSPDRRDVRRYVQNLQQVLVGTLERYGVEGKARTEPPAIGVWVGERKIASIGVHLSRWITTHGFALNIATDLAYFGGIVACGMPQVRMTSIAEETGTAPDQAELAAVCAEVFAAVFGYRLTPFPDRQASF